MKRQTPEMTHGERRRRRARMAKQLENGSSVDEVAGYFGVCSATVREAAREHGVKLERSQR